MAQTEARSGGKRWTAGPGRDSGSVFVCASNYREEWRKYRWIIFIIGLLFAAIPYALFRTWHVPCLIWVRSFVMRYRIMLEARPLCRIGFRRRTGVLCGQGLDTLDRVHNQLRHAIVVGTPSRMVFLTNHLWQFRVRHHRPVELSLENN